LAGSTELAELTELAAGVRVARGLERMRRAIFRLLWQRLPSEVAGTGAALLLGWQGGFDGELSTAMRDAGLAHLIAISGSHVALLAGWIMPLLGWVQWGRRGVGAAWRLGPRARLGVLSALLWLFAALCGFPVPVVRAVAMQALETLAVCAGRPLSSLQALLLVAWGLLLWNPTNLLSPSFQLTFAASAAIQAFAARGEKQEAGGILALENFLVAPLRVGLSATMGTLPLVIWHFGVIQSWGVLATIAAEPLVTAMLGGMLAMGAAAGLGAEWCADSFAGSVSLANRLLELCSSTVAGWPASVVPVGRPSLLLLLGIGLLLTWWAVRRGSRRPGGGAGWLGRRRWGQRVRRRLLLGAALLLLGWNASWAWALWHPELTLVAMDVGQGDAQLLRLPEGECLLVDAGPQGSARGVAREVARAGCNRPPALVLTHAHADHWGGATALLERGVVREVWVSAPALRERGRQWQELLELARKRRYPVLALGEGQVTGSAARIGVRLAGEDPTALGGRSSRIAGARPPTDSGPFEPPASVDPLPTGSLPTAPNPGTPLPTAPLLKGNAASVVLAVQWGERSLALMADLEASGEGVLLRRGGLGPAEVLKLGHHGSRSSSRPEWLEAMRPRWALVSVGAGNSYGHPSPEVVRRIGGLRSATGMRTLLARTDRDGALRMTGDAQGWRMCAGGWEGACLGIDTGFDPGPTSESGVAREIGPARDGGSRLE
jgi:competence protein ComEC